MKVLHITDQMPGYISGGNLGILQFSYAWTRVAEHVDYLGPIIEDKTISNWYKNVWFFDKPLTHLQKLKSMIMVQFNRNYICWKQMRKSFDNYDLIYIDSTKMSFALRDVRKSGFSGKIIVRAHNVEADFFKVNYIENHSFLNFLKYIVAKPRERYMTNNADCVLAITQEDKDRLIELYNLEEDKIIVCPVGVNMSKKYEVSFEQSGHKLRGLITGSLWFGPNASATMWFIENIYPEIRDICSITVAGFKPNDDLKNMCKKNSIELIDSPDTMQPYFEAADLFIAPIFNGGGMKVKIAEALSYGLPVVTTSHGAIGYKLEHGKQGYIADTADLFAQSIREYYNLTYDQKKKMKSEVSVLFNDNYSLNAIHKQIERILNT